MLLSQKPELMPYFSPKRDGLTFEFMLDLLAEKYTLDDVKNFTMHDFLNLKYEGSMGGKKYRDWDVTAFEYELMYFYIQRIRPNFMDLSKREVEHVFLFNEQLDFTHSSEKVFINPQGNTQLEFLGNFVSFSY